MIYITFVYEKKTVVSLIYNTHTGVIQIQHFLPSVKAYIIVLFFSLHRKKALNSTKRTGFSG